MHACSKSRRENCINVCHQKKKNFLASIVVQDQSVEFTLKNELMSFINHVVVFGHYNKGGVSMTRVVPLCQGGTVLRYRGFHYKHC